MNFCIISYPWPHFEVTSFSFMLCHFTTIAVNFIILALGKI